MAESVPVDHDGGALDVDLAELFTGLVRGAAFPGAWWAVATAGGTRSAGAAGWAVLDPERIVARRDTLFDVASLTKPMVTTMLALHAASRNEIDLTEPVSRILPEMSREGAGGATWIDLLSHRAGFEPWYPLYIEGSDRESYLEAIARRPLAAPPRSRVIYSDLGFLILQFALEHRLDAPLDALARQRVFDPLGMSESRFAPARMLRARIAATERDNAVERSMVAERGLSFSGFREGVIWGEVNDGNAWRLGGVAGHAGLFSTAGDVCEFGRRLLFRDGFVVPAELVDTSLENATAGLGESRGLGWQLRSDDPSHPSAPLSERSFGHTGFTGSSLFVDPARELVLVLLISRLHPSIRSTSMRDVRRAFHETVVRWSDRRDGA